MRVEREQLFSRKPLILLFILKFIYLIFDLISFLGHLAVLKLLLRTKMFLLNGFHVIFLHLHMVFVMLVCFDFGNKKIVV